MIESIQIDELDIRILQMLVEDSKIPYAELAREMDLSRAAITKRVNALIAKGVIGRFTVSVDPKVLGLDITVLFEISTLPARTALILDELEKRSEIGDIFLTGTTSLFAFAYFRDSGHLNEFLMRGISLIEGVQEIKTNVILESGRGRSMIGREDAISETESI